MDLCYASPPPCTWSRSLTAHNSALVAFKADVLIAPLAVGAGPAGVSDPTISNTIPLYEVSDPVTHGHDLTHNLMTWTKGGSVCHSGAKSRD